jgi:hypothetical protein
MANNGNIIGKLNKPTTSVASGIWDLREQLRSQRDGIWPLTNLIITNTQNLKGDFSDDSYTFSSADLGAASDFRHIIVVGVAIKAEGTGGVSSLTIGGVASTIAIQTTGVGGTFIAIAKVPLGSTGDIVVNYGVIVDNLAISVFNVQGSGNVTSVDSFTSTNLSGSQSITTVDGGVLVAMRMAGGAGSDLTLSWDGSSIAFNDTNTNLNTSKYLSAYSQTTTTSRTVSWTITGSPATRSLVVASFQP